MKPLRIVQLTDCHLFADRAKTLREIATWPRFISVLETLRRSVPEIDLIVVTGDTAHDEKCATYEAVLHEFSELADRVRIVPGNHDTRAHLRDLFAVASDGPTDRVTFHRQWDDWQVIGLDSQRPGELAGSLGDDQLQWLDQLLKETRSVHTLLFLHHPPVAVHSPWLDNIGLLDAAAFGKLLHEHSQVRLIGCGHVHQQLVASFGGSMVFTTPAVGPPFRARTQELEIDSVPPSFRLWELFPDGRWSTQVLC